MTETKKTDAELELERDLICEGIDMSIGVLRKEVARLTAHKNKLQKQSSPVSRLLDQIAALNAVMLNMEKLQTATADGTDCVGCRT